MLALATGVNDVAITITVVSAAAVLIFGADRFPPTRYVLDKLDPSRAWARHPSSGPPRPTGHVRVIKIDEDLTPQLPPRPYFDFDLDA